MNYMKKSIFVISLFVLLGTTVALQAQVLKRKYTNGFMLQPLTQVLKEQYQYAEDGVIVSNVLPESTAAAAAIIVNDIIISVNDIPIKAQRDFAHPTLAAIKAGDEVVYKVFRAGKTIILKAKAVPKAGEVKSGITYEYSEVSTSVGTLRVIISKPSNTTAKLPAVLFIQGSTCASVVDIDEKDPYRQVTDGITQQGFVVMRVEKPGIGESEKNNACDAIDFEQHVSLYNSAGTLLSKHPTVDAKRIFLFGHSFGGVIAPVLASKASFDISGIATFGALTSNWGNYLSEIIYLQVRQGGSATDEEATTYKHNIQQLAKDIFETNKPISEVAAANATTDNLLRQALAWQPNTNFLNGHSFAFNKTFHQIQPEYYWRKFKQRALIFYGSADFEAISEAYAKAPVQWLASEGNHKASFVVLENTDHAFAKVPSMEAGIQLKQTPQYAQVMRNNFDKDVIAKFVQWAMAP
jgi:pimeloyl-ACP methyl ester carboxylesterase